MPASGGQLAADTRRPLPRLNFALVDGLAKQVPPGRYALPKLNDPNNDVTFFEVAEGRRSTHRIWILSGAPGQFQQHTLSLSLQYFALTHLLEDLVSATALFGRKTATCGRCGSPLTRKSSREQGMGDHCKTERAAGR